MRRGNTNEAPRVSRVSGSLQQGMGAVGLVAKRNNCMEHA